MEQARAHSSIEMSRFAELTLDEFTSRLASSEPVPGGGSASAVAASLAASLLVMVAALSEGRPKYERYASTISRARGAGEAGRVRFLQLADADAGAYSRFVAARRLGTETDEERARRDAAVEDAARGAADVPLQIVRECEELAVEIEALAGRSNVNASSDLNVAALLLDAAARGASANVLTNLPSIPDPVYVGEATKEVRARLATVERLVRRVGERVEKDELREPEEE